MLLNLEFQGYIELKLGRVSTIKKEPYDYGLHASTAPYWVTIFEGPCEEAFLLNGRLILNVQRFWVAFLIDKYTNSRLSGHIC